MEAIDNLLEMWQRDGLSKEEVAKNFSQCILYVSCEPCIMCAAALSFLGIVLFQLQCFSVAIHYYEYIFFCYYFFHYPGSMDIFSFRHKGSILWLCKWEIWRVRINFILAFKLLRAFHQVCFGIHSYMQMFTFYFVLF